MGTNDALKVIIEEMIYVNDRLLNVLLQKILNVIEGRNEGFAIPPAMSFRWINFQLIFYAAGG